MVPEEELEAAGPHQEEDVATVAQVRVGATTLQPRLNSKSISIELDLQVKQATM